MVEPLRHRQTKGAATDMFDLQPPRHISTLPDSDLPACPLLRRCWGQSRHSSGGRRTVAIYRPSCVKPHHGMRLTLLCLDIGLADDATIVGILPAKISRKLRTAGPDWIQALLDKLRLGRGNLHC